MAIAIEVKVDAAVDIAQLGRHYEALRKQCSDRPCRVVLLTKTEEHKKKTEPLLKSVQLHERCWYDVAEKLKALPCSNEVSSFLKEQFTEFLKTRGMTMDKVEENLTTKDFLAFVHFMKMLKQAILESGFRKGLIHDHLIDDAGWGGFYFGSEKDWGTNPYWCGIEYARPKELHFHVRGLAGAQLDAALRDKWEREPDDKNGTQVCGYTHLLTDNGFFQKPALEQLRELKKFIGDRLAEVIGVAS